MALGRNAYTSRDERDKEQMPESADSGCPVFGKTGLADAGVDIRHLVGELFAAGFVLSSAHLLERGHKPPIRLVMEFSKPQEKPAMVSFPWTLFNQLTTTVFNQVDVWANPKQDNNKVVHTVNCGNRDDQAKPKYTLHYSNGDWGAEEISTPRP
jgi:hypothetical protein